MDTSDFFNIAYCFGPLLIAILIFCLLLSSFRIAERNVHNTEKSKNNPTIAERVKEIEYKQEKMGFVLKEVLDGLSDIKKQLNNIENGK